MDTTEQLLEDFMVHLHKRGMIETCLMPTDLKKFIAEYWETYQ